MALIWADGFDQYGGNSTFATQAGYTVSNLTIINNVAVARTGNGCCQFGSSLSGIIRPITAPTRVTGQGIGFNCYSAPTTGANNPLDQGLRWTLTNFATNQIAIVPNPNNGITVYLNSTAVGVSANNLWNLNSWYWLEGKVTTNSGNNTSDSSVIVQLQGSTILTINNLNFNGTIGYHGIGNNPSSSGLDSRMYMDDWIEWDNSGSFNNDFLGVRRCNTRYASANSALQDWVPASGNAWAEISAVPPVDATSYIQATAAGNISEFQHSVLGVETNDIAGVVVFPRAYLDSAGASTYRVGINSNSVVANSPEITPGTNGSYATPLILERDQGNGNSQWTPTSFDASLLRLTRDS